MGSHQYVWDDADPYTDTNSDSDSDTNTYTDTDTNANADADADVLCSMGRRHYLYSRSGCQLFGTAVHGACHAYRLRRDQLESEGFADLVDGWRNLWDADANTNTDADADADADADTDTDTNANSDTDTDADTNPDWAGQARARGLLAQFH